MSDEFQFIQQVRAQPALIAATLQTTDDQVRSLADEYAGLIDRVVLVGCGDPYMHAVGAAYAFEEWIGIPADSIEAAEFSLYRYRTVNERTLVILISSSGKTVKVLDAKALIEARGARYFALTNLMDGPLAQSMPDPRLIVHTKAGPSRAFPTKQTTTALAALYNLALHWAKAAGTLPEGQASALRAELFNIPQTIEKALSLEPQMEELAARYLDAAIYSFIGSGPNLATALLSAAKMKETSQSRAEGFNLEEFGHLHTLSIRGGEPVFIYTVPGDLGKRNRRIGDFIVSCSAHLIVVGPPEERDRWADIDAAYIEVPPYAEMFGPLVAWIPQQMFAHYVAVKKGLSPDKPVGRGDFRAIQEVIYTSLLDGWDDRP